jgi:hypothetical protein
LILGPAQPVWQIQGGAARRIDAGLESLRLTAAGDVLAGACRLPGDPLIKHVGPGGRSISYRSPGTIIIVDDDGTVRPVGSVASPDGVICQDRGRIWLLGFDHELGYPDRREPGSHEAS